ncbi:MAG: restriction endonuclease subunit S [Lentimicrobiaceae bacterium]|nr:restriction endonuclease subunit S [Lentimicrobiaceae bacterium]
MREKIRQPKVRFKEFAGENAHPWEQRKFDEITFHSGEKNKENLPYESYSITNEDGFVPQDEKFENGGSMKNADKSMYYIVTPNSFAYNPARINVGSIGYHKLAQNVIVSSLYEVFKTTDEVDDSFLWQWFKSEKFQRFIKLYQEGGVRLYFYYDKLCMSHIALPKIEEQEKIGLFFKNIDNLITLHQRELENTKDLKNTMLSKMFPKEGSIVPEIRFAGFTDPWEQRKAGDIFKSVSDKGHLDLPVLSASQELGMIRRDEIGIDIKYDEKSINTYKRVKPGQFVIHLRSFQGGFAWSDIEGITSPAYTVLDFKEPEKQVSKFWKEVLTSTTFIKRLETVTYGIRDGRSISFTDFSSLKFNLPNFEEQSKIGKFFVQLDNLITLHQRELETYQNLKKTMLEKMFV